MEKYPRARQEQLIVRSLDQETLVYDTNRNVAFTLNPTASAVWNGCDGQTPIPALTQRVSDELGAPLSQDTVWLALRELEKSHLLAAPLPANAPRVTRRELIGVGVTIALLPIVASLVAPTPAQAQSSGATGPTGDTGATGPTG